MSENKKFKVIDLFAGAGGLSNGFEQTGKFEVVGAVELNPAAATTFIKNHNDNEDIIIKTDTKNSDITKINFRDFIDGKKFSSSEIVVIGGPPCQGFSNANRQKNYLISGNNQLVKEYVRAIDEINPIAFLMENVKTMDSEVHKFFVTEAGEETKLKYGSESHLEEIMKSSGETLDELVKNDKIVLVKTRFFELEEIFQEIVKYQIKKPFLESGPLLSRLRSIERKTLKSDKYQIIKTNEIKEVTNIIIHFESLLDSDLYAHIDLKGIFGLAIETLKNLLQYSVKKEEILLAISRLLDVNQFLLNLKEVSEEKIVTSIPFLDSNGDFLMFSTNVKSYNVVQYLKRVFAFLGYEIDDKVLTATDYGVPQKRNRYMILGVKQGKLIENNKVNLPSKFFSEHKTTKDAIKDLEGISPQHDVEKYVPIKYKAPTKKSDLQKYYRKDADDYLYNHINTKSKDLSIKRFEAIKKSGGKNFHSLADELKSTYSDASRTQNTIYLRLKYDEPSPTVVNVRKSMWNHPTNAVALSIREAARLQTFQDKFKFYGKKDQQYQQIGNAVPPLMARAVAEQMLCLLGEEPIESIRDEFNLNVLEGSM